MSMSGVGLTKANDSDIAAYRRLEAKIIAEEREKDPNFSTCPKCVSRITRKFRHNHHDDGYVAKNLDESDLSEVSSQASSRRQSRVHRYSIHETEPRPSFSGAFR